MPQISAVTTDANGRLLSFIEGVYTVTVRRNSAGLPLVAKADSPGRKSLISEFKYSSSGQFTGLVGNFESVLIGHLVGEASRGGSVATGINFVDVTTATATIALSAGINKITVKYNGNVTLTITGPDNSSYDVIYASGFSGTATVVTP